MGGFQTNESEWSEKVEIRRRKIVQAVGKACEAAFGPTQALTGEKCPLWVRSRGDLNCGVHSTPVRGFSACLHRLHVCSTIVFIA